MAEREESMRTLALALLLLTFGFLLGLAFLPAPAHPDPRLMEASREYSEAWACRCDTCCDTLDRILDGKGK